MPAGYFLWLEKGYLVYQDTLLSPKWLKSAVQACVKIVIFLFIMHLEVMFSKQNYRDIF